MSKPSCRTCWGGGCGRSNQFRWCSDWRPKPPATIEVLRKLRDEMKQRTFIAHTYVLATGLGETQALYVGKVKAYGNVVKLIDDEIKRLKGI